MDNKVMNININNYYIQTLNRRKKKTTHTSRGESNMPSKNGQSGETLDKVRKMERRLRTSERGATLRLGKRKTQNNQVIKDKVDRILKKYFMDRHKSLKFKLKPKTKKKIARKNVTVEGKENDRHRNLKVPRRVKTRSGSKKGKSMKKQLDELIFKKARKTHGHLRESTGRKAVFGYSSRRSVGKIYENMFENKKSLGVRIYFIWRKGVTVVAHCIKEPDKRTTPFGQTDGVWVPQIQEQHQPNIDEYFPRSTSDFQTSTKKFITKTIT
jgi:hypothetical protein